MKEKIFLGVAAVFLAIGLVAGAVEIYKEIFVYEYKYCTPDSVIRIDPPNGEWCAQVLYCGDESGCH